MGQSCSFVSPGFFAPSYDQFSLPVTYIPVYAVDPTNSGYLSVSGRFQTAGPGGANCPIATKVNSQTLTITPYLVGPDAITTRCNGGLIAPSSTDTSFNYVTTFTPFACPEAVLTAMPTGTWTLGFEQPQNLDTNAYYFYTVTHATQKFVIIPLTSTISTTTTTTLPTPFAITTTTTATVTSDVTNMLPPTPSSTTTTTVYTTTIINVVFSTETPVETVISTVNTCTSTPTSTPTSNPTSTSTSSASTPSACAAGTAASGFSCPAADDQCYTAANGDLYQISCGRGHVQGDLASVQRNSLESCIAACSSYRGVSACIGLSFTPATGRNTLGQCYLKKNIDTPVQASQTRSGAVLIRKGSAQPVARRDLEERQGRTGSRPDFTLNAGQPRPSTTTTFTSTSSPDPSGTATVSTTTTVSNTINVGPSASGVQTDTVSTDTTVVTTSVITSSSKTTVTTSICASQTS